MNFRYLYIHLYFSEKYWYVFFCKFPRFFNQLAGYPKNGQFKLCLETSFHFKYLLIRDSGVPLF